MNVLSELKSRFKSVLQPLTDDVDTALEMIRPAQDSRFGDYQANCAMSLGNKLGKPPREIAQQIVDGLVIDDLCEPPDIAGPGFINLKLRSDWLKSQVDQMISDERIGVAETDRPKKYVVDYSSPNVAKSMHVGHIRSTVIGDALYRILKFLGHDVISDNHVGDWGTQFGMIIYGYRNFVDAAAYEEQPIAELSRVYRMVRQVMDYHSAVKRIPEQDERISKLQSQLATAEAEPATGDKAADKKKRKDIERLKNQIKDAEFEKSSLHNKIAAVDGDVKLKASFAKHAAIGRAVLDETAKLHEGDAENLKLWNEFLPKCLEDIQRIYDRLGVTFDHTHGESFYDNKLADVVSSFEEKKLSKESEGAVCVFLDGFEAPMIIRKRDGAFLYATTDLATIRYRMEKWSPDVILYVVDFRQGEHFDKLFAAARLWGYDSVDLRHIKFGTVLGVDKKPYRTRDGDTVGLEGLLDAAVARAKKIVSENDDSKPNGAELSAEERDQVANIIGHGAIKYADLSQNRVSDYVYSEDKMVALRGNTAAYIQYSYARIKTMFARGGVDVDTLKKSDTSILLDHDKERALALCLLRFSEATDEVTVNYEPHLLTAYLFELAGRFAEFYEACPVLKSSEQERGSRILLCDLVSRALKLGLTLLGIETVEKM